MHEAPLIVEPIGIVRNSRKEPEDDFWGNVVSEIALLPHLPEEAFDGIETFSHLEIVTFFHRAEEAGIVHASRPRGDPDFPRVGIFAQRKKDRPNRLGLATVELLSRDGRILRVRRLDAIDGTPVLDIKPVFREFQPGTVIRQPGWVAELMKEYWK